MSQPASSERGRETRLLLGTIIVSVIVLVVLAQFRFPEETGGNTAEPAPAPLERLAARATFDELATIMTDLERRLSPRLSVVQIEPERESGSYAVAPRMTTDRAVAVLGPGEVIVPSADAGQRIIGRDPNRDLAVIAVPPASDGAVTPRTGAARPGPRYVVVVEGSAQGPVVRPAYLARTDAVEDPRTHTSLLQVTALQQALPRGAALFTLAGTFIGVVSEGGSRATVVPADSMIAAALSVHGGGEMRGDLAIEVQALSPGLAKAAGANSGVIVSYVHPQGPAAQAVEPGDVIAAIDGINVTTPAGFLRLVRSRAPGSAVAVHIIRRGKPVDVSVSARDITGPPLPAIQASDPGLTLRTVSSLGSEVVAVQSDGAAAKSGLAVGDIIVRLDSNDAPSVAEILRAYRDADSGAALLLTVQRGTRQLVAALEKP